MRTIVLASQQGGSGKTTIAARLAVALERAGQVPAEIATLCKFVNSLFAENPKGVKRKEKALVETRHLD